jgi:hypothetical protein
MQKLNEGFFMGNASTFREIQRYVVYVEDLFF